MAKKKSKSEKVFNDRSRKIFRKYIGNTEVIFSAFFIGFTLLMGWWFIDQRDAYNPEDRDISYDLLVAQQVEDHLYEPPLQRWRDPSMAVEGLVTAPSIDTGIFPPSIVENGWTTDSAFQQFDPNTLYEKINGQEVQYKAFGFQQLDYIALAGPEEDLYASIELYDMGEFKNALGIFAAQRNPDATVLSEGALFYYPTEVGALGIVDKYYVKITGSADSEIIRDHAVTVLKDFAASVDASAGTTPPGFMVLAGGMGIDFSGIEYQKEDVFQYSFAKEFWFGRVPEAGENARVFVHLAESEDAAATLLRQMIEELAWDYTEVERTETRAVFEHEFLKTNFVVEQRGPYVYGIDGAADRESATGQLNTLQENLLEDSI